MLGKRVQREEEIKTMPADNTQEQNRQQAEQVSQGQAKTKPLRFVTNYGAPHPKRRRIGAACLTCAYPYCGMQLYGGCR